RLRAEAMQEIWTQGGFEGVVRLLSHSEAAYTVGGYASLCLNEPGSRGEFLRRCLAAGRGMEEKLDGCMQGFLGSVDTEACGAILATVAVNCDADQLARGFRCAPFRQETWSLLEQYGDYFRDRYWREVVPYWSRHSDAELTELVDRLLDAGRPRAVFSV